MRTIIATLLLAAVAAAEEPTKPAIAPVAPKTALLSEVQQLRIEKVQAQLQLLKQQEERLTAEAMGAVTDACKGIGGITASDCTVVPPAPGETRAMIRLNVKPEVKK
jgi:hypothetical protein